jgi:hypothetical protein
VADELPLARDRGFHDVRIGDERAAIDVHDARNFELVVDLQQTPESDLVAVSFQHQLGISGIGEPPAGGVITVRGIGCVASHSSTLVMVQTTMRA